MRTTGTDPRLVFVYGTLLAGERNHHVLGGSRLVRAARTPAAFELRDLGHFPGLLRGGTQAVEGEVYDVTARVLADLDRLEDHPTFYHREHIILDDGGVAWSYVLTPDKVAGCPVIDSGNWRHRNRPRKDLP